MRHKLVGFLVLVFLQNNIAQNDTYSLLGQFHGHGKITTFDYEDGRLYLISKKLLEVFKLSSSNSINKIGEYNYPVDNNSLPTEIHVKNGFLYSSNGNKGLWIIDVTDMETIRPRRDFFPSITNTAQGFNVFGNIMCLSQVIGYGSSSILFVEIIDPITLKELGKYILPFYSENFSYQIKNNFLYVVAQKYYEYNYSGADLIIVDISDFENPLVVYQEHSSFRNLAINDKYLYVSDSTSVLKIFDISDQKSPKLINSINYNINSSYNRSIDFKINNNKLLVNQRTQIGDKNCWLYNLNSAGTPEFIDSLLLPYEINNGHRNISIEDGKIFTNKDYSVEYFEIAGNNINDQNKLQFVEEFNSKEIIIENTFLYLLADKGFYIIDIEDPSVPVFKSGIKITGTSIKKVENYIYMSGSTDLRIIDVADAENPIEISYSDTYDFTSAVSVNNKFAFLTYSSSSNEINGVKIIDVSDPLIPNEIKSFDIGIRTNQILVDSVYMYVSAGKSSLDSLSGIYIYNISDVENIVELAYINEIEPAYELEVSNNELFYSTAKKIQIYNIEDKTEPKFLSTFNANHYIGDIKYLDNKLYLASGTSGVIILDIDDIKNPYLIDNIDTYWVTSDLAIDTNLLFSAEASGGGVLIFELESGRNGTEETQVKLKLEQNYPNPFNSGTIIEYSIPKEEHIKIKVFDILGREVSKLVDEIKQPGINNVEFNASKYSSGIYFYQLKAGEYSAVKKMILLR